jgi:hypothetical protein
MFREDNRYMSSTRTYRFHHTQATIELELLQYSYQRVKCDHYYIISGACISIKSPHMFLSFFHPHPSYFAVSDEACTIINASRECNPAVDWITTDNCKLHFQFFCINREHTRWLVTLPTYNSIIDDLIRVQAQLFAHYHPEFKYSDLTDPAKMERITKQYKVKDVPGPAEWMIYTMLAYAMMHVHKVAHSVHDVRALIENNRGTYQDHLYRHEDVHPIEFPDLDTPVLIEMDEPTTATKKKNTKKTNHHRARKRKHRNDDNTETGAGLKVSLRVILTKKVVSSALFASDSSGACALWDDDIVCVLRKVASSPKINQNTWR